MGQRTASPGREVWKPHHPPPMNPMNSTDDVSFDFHVALSTSGSTERRCLARVSNSSSEYSAEGVFSVCSVVSFIKSGIAKKNSPLPPTTTQAVIGRRSLQ
jgi:hypothetical protein